MLSYARLQPDEQEASEPTDIAKIKKHQQPSLLSRIKARIKKHPRIWQALKWLALGALAATALYFSGGLAALPYVAQLGAWAIPAATPFLAVAKAVLWTYVFKPIGTALLRLCGFPRSSSRNLPPVASSVSPTHSLVLNQLEKEASIRLDKEVEPVGEAAWYSPLDLEKLIYAPEQAGHSSNGLKYIFLDQDEYGNGPSFKLQLERLRMLKNKTKAPFAYFISKAPAEFNTSHFIMGLLFNNHLYIINPTGDRGHRPLYEQLEAARAIQKVRGEIKTMEEIVVSRTPIQRDPKSIENCGPICAELLCYLSSLPAEQLTRLLTSAEKTSQPVSLLPHCRTIDLAASGLLPPSLQGLVNAVEPTEYVQNIKALRAEQQKTLKDGQAPIDCDERDLMNELVLEDKVDVFALEENQRLVRLRSRFASPSSFGVGSSARFAASNVVPLRPTTTTVMQNTHTNTGPK